MSHLDLSVEVTAGYGEHNVSIQVGHVKFGASGRTATVLKYLNDRRSHYSGVTKQAIDLAIAQVKATPCG